MALTDTDRKFNVKDASVEYAALFAASEDMDGIAFSEQTLVGLLNKLTPKQQADLVVSLIGFIGSTDGFDPKELKSWLANLPW